MVARQYRSSIEEFEQQARFWTESFAHDKQMVSAGGKVHLGGGSLHPQSRCIPEVSTCLTAC